MSRQQGLYKTTGYGTTHVHYVPVHVQSCSDLRVPGNWNYDQLAGPFWRFYWNATRGAYVLQDGRRIDLAPSRCFLIPPDTPFAARQERPVSHFCIHFLTTPSRLRLKPGVYGMPMTSRFRQAIAELRARFRRETGSPTTLQTSLLVQSFVYEALCRMAGPHLMFEHRDERIDRILSLMEANLSAPLPVAELARRAGLNINAAINTFRKAIGQTPRHYYCRLRLEKAVLLLLTKNLSIEEIAQETGFCDRYHFSRLFSRQYEMGPAQFRAMHGGRPDATDLRPALRCSG
ncbi:MAG: AraC family transcriptional regulator [Kiritimatiellae bacterium]|nr:AraC family transcriptional regulator [Kiritimatiellia bacterium]